MKKVKLIILISLSSLLLCLAGLISYAYMQFRYTDDNYKWIDLRKTWPKGYWMQAKFVEMGDYGQECIVLKVPLDNLNEFERVLKQEIRRSPKSYYPRWDVFQLRIVTTEGKYTTVAMLGTDEISANTWQSKNLKQLLFRWGHSEPWRTYPDPNDPINRKNWPNIERVPQ